ncbi:hypothetical protein [Streptomyces sp. S1]|uniref:hypothetical protein n=1 Tax=Streptomyces sp. S1 TaxID=718288 RepID=UPI003D74E8ED
MVSLPPPRTTEIFYDGAWHPVSVRESDTVTITRGLTGKGTRAEPTNATMRLGNRNGEVSAHDPRSDLYGKIGRNTPLKFSVDGGRPYLRLPGDATSALTCPDSPALAVTDLDLRIEVALDSYTDVQELAARGTADSQRSWSLRIGPGWIQLSWYPTGAFASQKAATVNATLPVAPRQPLALRVVLDVDNGSGGHLLSVFWARSITTSRWTLLGTASAGAGTTMLHDGTAGLHVGTSPGLADPGAKGRIHAFDLWDGATGTRKVRLDFSTAQAGDTSFTEADGLVWSVQGAAVLSDRHVRLEGEVPAWPPERHVSGADSTVPIAPAGILRRLGIGKRPLPSALRRAITTRGPIECWPLTDGPEATTGAPLIGTAPVRSSGGLSKFVWGKGALEDWIEPVLQVASGTASDMTAVCPPSSAAAGGWAVDWVRAGTGGLEVVRLLDRGAGAARMQWTVIADSSAGVVRVYAELTETGATFPTVTVDTPGLFDGRAHHLRLQTTVTTPGSGTSWSVYVDGQALASSYWANDTAPLQQFQYTALLGSPGSGAVSIGYVTYWGAAPPHASVIHKAMTGHTGESAAARITRVAAEQGVPVDVDGDPAETEPLGIQKMETFLTVLETASNADLGYLLERRDARALLYRTRHTLYSQDPAVTLDYTQGVISRELRPADDDRLSRNEITVTRDGGSEHTAVLETGRMSVQDPPNGIGQYEEAVPPLSLAADAQTVQQAWWRLHLGTHEGLRYPRITVDLANPRAYALISALLAADVGDILRLQRLPDEYGPDDVDLIIRGYTEEIGAKTWKITFVCDPGTPWTVGLLGDPALGRLGTDGCTLAAAATKTATTLRLASDPGPPWITTASHPTEFPLDLRVGGEVVRVTGITPAVADNFGRTVASGWGTADVGGAWTATGGSASDYAVSGGVGSHTLGSVNVSRRTTVVAPSADVELYADVAASAVATGAAIYGGLIARATSGDDLYYARIEFLTGGALALTIRKRLGGTETTVATATVPYTYTAGATVRLRFQVKGSTLRAMVWPIVGGGEPETWQVSGTDTSHTAAGAVGARSILATGNTNTSPAVRYDNLATPAVQLATVARAVNGVDKPHAAGAPVQLAQPFTLAL